MSCKAGIMQQRIQDHNNIKIWQNFFQKSQKLNKAEAETTETKHS